MTSEPPGSEWHLDGSKSGTTPDNLADVAPGSHRVTVKKDGYEEWADAVIVRAGETVEVAVTLRTKPRPTTVTTAPAPAFTGRHISLDFKGADVKDLLRLLAEGSGVNIVVDPEVKGIVTIKLEDVPWDQVLDIILKINRPKLAMVRESGNIIRITPAAKYDEEK